MYRVTMIFVALLFFTHPVWAFDDSAYTPYALDQLLDEFKASRPGEVEITLFKPLRFDAEVVALPTPKQTAYVQRLIRDFSQGEPATVTHGMRVRSAEGRDYSLYVMDELVPQANELMIPGDQATFYVYHAYNAQNGPGLILKSFLRHPRPTLWDKASAWLQSLTATQE